MAANSIRFGTRHNPAGLAVHHLGNTAVDFSERLSATGHVKPALVLVSSEVGAALHYIIVKRGRVEDYNGLYKLFGSRVPVVWDRRRVNRPIPVTGDAGPTERRQASPPSWAALGFVVVDRTDD